MEPAAQPRPDDLSDAVALRRASGADVEALRRIYNEGIEDRIATLDADPKTLEEIGEWWDQHTDRFGVFVAVAKDHVVGWASLNRFSHRCAHADIADLSVYVARNYRGKGIGSKLLHALIKEAAEKGFHKIVLHALNLNEHGKRLYRSVGFVEIGVFKRHGRLDGRFVDVVAMELLLQ
jgi:L-amino acid N-acyltransferase YncA